MHPAAALLVLAIGVFGPDAARAQELQNLVENGDFDTNLASWTNLAGPKVWSPFDRTDDPESGSIAISNTSGTPNGQLVQQCIPVVGGADYLLAYSHYSETVGVTTGRADVSVYWYDNPTCAGASITFALLNSTAAPGAWNDLENDLTAPQSAVTALVRLVAWKLTGAAGDAWRVYYDHVQLVPEPASAAQLVAACGALMLRARTRPRRAR